MADIELVIKIPEEVKRALDNNEEYRLYTESICRAMLTAIKNGTSLPKGHGRLIDAGKLDTRERGNNSQRTMWWNIGYIVERAQTIVEADKEESEDKECR